MLVYSSKKKGLKKEYIAFIKWLHSNRTSNISIESGNRKVFENLVWDVNDFFSPGPTLEDLGYAPVKMTQLKKIYEDQVLLGEAKEVLKKQWDKTRKGGRRYVSASLSFVTGTKGSVMGGRLKSYCMTSAVYMLNETGGKMVVFYRTTEAVKKFGADLLFLQNTFRRYIPSQLLRQIRTVRFYFTQLYIASIYYPLAYTFGVRVPRQKSKCSSGFHRRCHRDLERADDPATVALYAQTERSYRRYKAWKLEKEHARSARKKPTGRC